MAQLLEVCLTFRVQLKAREIWEHLNYKTYLTCIFSVIGRNGSERSLFKIKTRDLA